MSKVLHDAQALPHLVNFADDSDRQWPKNIPNFLEVSLPHPCPTDRSCLCPSVQKWRGSSLAAFLPSQVIQNKHVTPYHNCGSWWSWSSQSKSPSSVSEKPRAIAYLAQLRYSCHLNTISLQRWPCHPPCGTALAPHAYIQLHVYLYIIIITCVCVMFCPLSHLIMLNYTQFPIHQAFWYSVSW